MQYYTFALADLHFMVFSFNTNYFCASLCLDSRNQSGWLWRCRSLHYSTLFASFLFFAGHQQFLCLFTAPTTFALNAIQLNSHLSTGYHLWVVDQHWDTGDPAQVTTAPNKGFSNRNITISYLYMNAPLNFFNELSMSKR